MLIAVRKFTSERAATRTNEIGLSLVELLVVMMLLTVIGAIAVAGIAQGLRTTAYGQDRVDALAATQTAVERISRELRAADPVYRSDSDHVEVGIHRNEQFSHFVYEVVPEGDAWRLREERWVFEDPDDFSVPDFAPIKAEADLVTERTLIADLGGADVFTFFAADGEVTTTPSQATRVQIEVERIVQPGKNPIVVTTLVKLRNA